VHFIYFDLVLTTFSHDTLRRLMAYIVDLTLILQNLFWLTTQDEIQTPLTRRLIKLAFQGYNKSIPKAIIHTEISRHVKETNIFQKVDRDITLLKVKELINRYRIEKEEMLKLKDEFGLINSSVAIDEPWDVSSSSTQGS
jgi:hypothetical protein